MVNKMKRNANNCGSRTMSCLIRLNNGQFTSHSQVVQNTQSHARKLKKIEVNLLEITIHMSTDNLRRNYVEQRFNLKEIIITWLPEKKLVRLDAMFDHLYPHTHTHALRLIKICWKT